MREPITHRPGAQAGPRTGRARAVAALLALLLPAAVWGDTVITVFGPKTYVRGKGKPVEVRDSFTVADTSLAYTLRIRNGPHEDGDRDRESDRDGDRDRDREGGQDGDDGGELTATSDAVVTLNGTQVLGPSDFARKPPLIQIPVTLRSSNVIKVEIRSKPGSSFVLDIFGNKSADTTPPSITAAATPAPNAAGWNNSNVTVTFTCSDAGSGIATCPAPVTVTTEGAGQVVTGTAVDKAGNRATTSVTINLDKTAPVIAASANPAANAAGWNNSAVTVTFNCSDALSGVADCAPPATRSSEGANQAVGGTATDKAGNTATAGVTLNIDQTPPVITASKSPPANAAGWNNSNVVVSFDCHDDLSGVASCASPVTTSSEGANQTVSGTATDKAGNTAAATAALNIDKTPPTITAAATPAPNANGWNDGDVTVTFSCADAISDVSCPPPVTVSTEGAGQVRGGTATDQAGNTASAQVSLNIDKTPPTVTTSISPAPNEHGWNNAPATVSFSCSDSLSGVVTCPDPIAVSTEGQQLVTGVATDRAGHSTPATAQVNLDFTPPVVTLTSPSDGTERRVPRVEVRGTVSDASPLKSIKVSGTDIGVDTLFSTEVALQPGSQVIPVVASDLAGNVGRASVTVVYSRLPTVKITSPADLAVFGRSPIDVSGAVDDPTTTVTVGVERVPAVVSGTTFTATGVNLQEGGNVVTAVATSTTGNAASDSLTLVLDTTAPRVFIDSPPSGSVTRDATVTVTGRINDVVLGTINSGQAQVVVNGRPAEVSNRTFMAKNVPLDVGTNTITAEGHDAAGNSDTTTITVLRESVPGKRISIVSGNEQSAEIDQPLAEPLVVAVSDTGGVPLAGQTVIFRVGDNNGYLVDAASNQSRGAVATTDGSGQAQLRYVLGSRAGAGSNRVDVTSPGITGGVTFIASTRARPPAKINVDSGTGQKGAVEQPLPWPFVAVVTDQGHNRLGNVAVTFSVVSGGGDFSGQSAVTVRTDTDGRALAVLTLGPHAGVANNVVTASVENLAGLPAAFSASGVEPGDPAQTRIRGVVLDNSNVAISGVTVRVRGTTVAVQSDAQGQFVLAGVPVGDIHLVVDGSTAQRPGTWPDLEFEMVTVAGAENTLGMPVYLLALDLAHGIFVDETHGGTLTLPDYPGFSLTVAPNSATFPDGTRRGTITVTVVHADKVPMVPNFGQQPRFIVTIQPHGLRFDPPAQVTHPNVDALPPGAVTELYSFDHDMGSFVATGTATVSEDGTVIRSDRGTGILKGGWHCGGNPATAGTAADCPECQTCDGVSCVAGPDGGSCGAPPTDDCLEAKCQGGACSIVPKPDGTSCDTGNQCTTGQCQSGFCTETNKPDGTACDDGVPCGDPDTPDQCEAGECKPACCPV